MRLVYVRVCGNLAGREMGWVGSAVSVLLSTAPAFEGTARLCLPLDYVARLSLSLGTTRALYRINIRSYSEYFRSVLEQIFSLFYCVVKYFVCIDCK